MNSGRGEVLHRDLFDSFGISSYHAKGIRGAGVKILVVDTGMSETDTDGENTHGLAVRSLIKAPANEHGLVGIAPESELTLVDVHDAASIPIDLLISAMRRGVEDGVDIMSISLGTNDSYEPLQSVIDFAHENRVLVFAAAGNSGMRAYEYPASCFKAISVGSLNEARQLSGFNTKNDAVAVFAPGEKIRLLGPGGQLKEYTGTSFATPFAAGLAALALCAARQESADKSLRLARRDMIDLLRSPSHLSLDCDTHTYVMDRTCTNYNGPPDHERQSSIKASGSSSVIVWIWVLLAAIALGGFLMLAPLSKLDLLRN